jgi:uncharacterized protein YjbI with pentapeptide repeats
MDPSPAAIRRADELNGRLAAAALWITTNGAQGCPAVLDGEDLRPLGEAFEKAQLAAFSAKGACGVGVSFRGAQLQGAKFDMADLRDANFTGADLRGASFRGANLWHAKFNDADLRPLRLASGVRPVDLTEASCARDTFDSCLSE